jgi:hypothetical protein
MTNENVSCISIRPPILTRCTSTVPHLVVLVVICVPRILLPRILAISLLRFFGSLITHRDHMSHRDIRRAVIVDRCEADYSPGAPCIHVQIWCVWQVEREGRDRGALGVGCSGFRSIVCLTHRVYHKSRTDMKNE